MITPKQPTGSLSNSYAPLKGCGVAQFEANDLGFPGGTVVPFTPATVVSNPLAVAGYHQFLFLVAIKSDNGAVQAALNVQICDPFTGVSLDEIQVGLIGIGGGQLLPIPFGAFTGIGLTPSWSWNVIRLALQITAGAAGSTGIITDPTIVPNPPRAPDLFCQTR